MMRSLLAVALVLVACSSDNSQQTDGGGGDSGSSGTAAKLCVDTINSYRAQLGLPPYGEWGTKESCADGQAKSDSQSGTAHGAFGQCTEMAQNECPGWTGPPEQMIPKCLAQMWAEGPGTDFTTHGHYINMSSTQYTEVACGFYTMSDGTTVWAVQDFK